MSAPQQLLKSWLDANLLRAVDCALGHFCIANGQSKADVGVLAAIASRELANGHICIDIHNLENTLAQYQSFEPQSNTFISPSQWWQDNRLRVLHELDNSTVVTQQPAQASAPLAYCHGRLYLYRMWHHEDQVAQHIKTRALETLSPEPSFSQHLQRLFQRPKSDWQKLACAVAATGTLTLLTGGPGTGKTTTVVRLLALLQQQAQDGGREAPIMGLAAPTGKAAARLTESIRSQINSLPVDLTIKERIPNHVSTLHRLLGSLPDTRAFRHNAQNPLNLDVLVVDEASMIDLEMLDNLLQALPAKAQLILIGDKDQLASVEAGAVLGELCAHAKQGLYSRETQNKLAQLCGSPVPEQIHGENGVFRLKMGVGEKNLVEQRTVMLRDSHRFGGQIGKLAAAINDQDKKTALHILQAKTDDLDYRDLQTPADLNPLIQNGYTPFIEVLGQKPMVEFASEAFQIWVHELLAAFDDFRLLCAIRQGELGVEGLNARAERVLAAKLNIRPGVAWYEGRPVMMRHNDYSLGLMNGDIGITLDDGQGRLRVAFAKAGGGLRFVLPSRLTGVETVYAMTVHKSQGSEFTHSAVILPQQHSPVLTKELLYTGITRARKKLSLYVGHPSVLTRAIHTRVVRHSGLRQAIEAKLA